MRTIMICLAIISLSVVAYIGMKQLRTPPSYATRNSEIEHKVLPSFDIASLNKELASAIDISNNETQIFAKTLVEEWHNSIMKKIDNDFLDWYFGYIRNQREGFRQLFDGLLHGSEEASRKTAERVTDAFTSKVMPPLLIDRTIVDISVRVTEFYIDSLRIKINNIPDKFKIPPSRWDSYLSDISKTVSKQDPANNFLEDLSLKAVVGSSVATTVIVAKVAIPLIGQAVTSMGGLIGLKAAGMGVGVAGKAIAGTVIKITGAKVGTTVAIKGASTLGGPVVAVAVLTAMGAWEWWSHSTYVAENRPNMRKNLEDFLLQFERDLLKSDGVIGQPIYQINRTIYETVAH